MENDNIDKLTKELLENANNLQKILDDYQSIDGVSKLYRKIKKEIDFFQKKKLENSIKLENLKCTNLTHFSALVQTLQSVKNCIYVERVFTYGNKKLCVDIVCDHGKIWIKVIARNSKSLSQIISGNASYGTKSIIDQALEYIECSKESPIFFNPPKIYFYFLNDVEDEIKLELSNLGIESIKNLQEMHTSLPSSNRLNLDISTMLAYVSNLTNGYDNFIYKEPLLNQQAIWERESHVKPVLDQLFDGKELICCETALKSFQEILNEFGGEKEKLRSIELLKHLKVFPDNYQINFENIINTVGGVEEKHRSEELLHRIKVFPDNSIGNENSAKKILQEGGKIKPRSKIIFEFGERMSAVTVTSNEGFVRAAKQQGVDFTVFIHESRALTERKDRNAIAKPTS